jgi:hypothetical protein
LASIPILNLNLLENPLVVYFSKQRYLPKEKFLHLIGTLAMEILAKDLQNFIVSQSLENYEITLTVTDKKTNHKEKITKEIEIPKEAIIPRIIKIKEELKDKLELISTTLEKKVTEFGRTVRDLILIKSKYLTTSPVGIINVHFEKTKEDIDLTNLIADIDPKTKKSILYMPQWPEVIDKDKVLFIPK